MEGQPLYSVGFLARTLWFLVCTILRDLRVMKYIILFLLLLVGCEQSTKINPKCVDGWFLVNHNNFVFCKRVSRGYVGFMGKDCYGVVYAPQNQEVPWFSLPEGWITETRCYNLESLTNTPRYK